MSVDYSLVMREMRSSLIMVSPWKKMTWTARYEKTDATKHFVTEALIDDAHTYGLDMNIGIVEVNDITNLYLDISNFEP